MADHPASHGSSSCSTCPSSRPSYTNTPYPTTPAYTPTPSYTPSYTPTPSYAPTPTYSAAYPTSTSYPTASYPTASYPATPAYPTSYPTASYPATSYPAASYPASSYPSAPPVGCSTCPTRTPSSCTSCSSYPGAPTPGCTSCPPRPPYPPIYVATGPTGPAGPSGANPSSYYLKGSLSAGTILPEASGVILSIPFTIPSGVVWNQLQVNGSFSFQFMNPTFTVGGFYMSIDSVEGNTYNSKNFYINSVLNKSEARIGSGTISDTFETKSLVGGTSCQLRLVYTDLAETGLTISDGTYSFQIASTSPL